jgi:hypothetical protein
MVPRLQDGPQSHPGLLVSGSKLARVIENLAVDGKGASKIRPVQEYLA